MSRRRIVQTQTDIENPQLTGLPYYLRQLHARRYLDVLKMAAASPGFTQKELAVEMGLHASNVGYLCRHLVDCGLLVMRKIGKVPKGQVPGRYWLPTDKYAPSEDQTRSTAPSTDPSA